MKIVIHIFVCSVIVNIMGGSFHQRNINDLKKLSPQFTDYEIVKPQIYHPQEKRHISSTIEKGGTHIDNIHIYLKMAGKESILDLNLNNGLISKDFFHIIEENGHRYIETSQEGIGLCHYTGKILGRPNSWVALSTCHGIAGIIVDGKSQYYIEKYNCTKEENAHILYQTNRIEGNGTHDIVYENSEKQPKRVKRERNEPKIFRGSSNASIDSRYIELLIVADNGLYRRLFKNKVYVLNYAISITNFINMFYSQVNFFVVLVGVDIWTKVDEIDHTRNNMLKDFYNYTMSKLLKTFSFDTAQLISSHSAPDCSVELPYANLMCQSKTVVGANTDLKHELPVALRMAHTIGHHLGLEHDTVECECAQMPCLMAPRATTSENIPSFSTCSIQRLNLYRAEDRYYCLRNKPAEIPGLGSSCGNGIVEEGEECDCGLYQHCKNKCCDAVKCKLKPHAACATGDCCDLSTCQIKVAATLCRPTNDECDLPEYCLGNSENCPEDTYKLDTNTCQNDTSYCHRGFCESSGKKCVVADGSIKWKRGHRECHRINGNSTRALNQCEANVQDVRVKCDTRWYESYTICKNSSYEMLKLDQKTVVISSQIYAKRSAVVVCSSVMMGLNINVESGIELCPKDIECMSLSQLRHKMPIFCPLDCSGNGWCNNKGACHCQDGFLPPDCSFPGPGGSIMSGPSSVINGHKNVVNAILIIFLGVIPLFASLALLARLIYRRYKGPENSSKSTILTISEKVETDAANAQVNRLSRRSLLGSIRNMARRTIRKSGRAEPTYVNISRAGNNSAHALHYTELDWGNATTYTAVIKKHVRVAQIKNDDGGYVDMTQNKHFRKNAVDAAAASDNMYANVKTSNLDVNHSQKLSRVSCKYQNREAMNKNLKSPCDDKVAKLVVEDDIVDKVIDPL